MDHTADILSGVLIPRPPIWHYIPGVVRYPFYASVLFALYLAILKAWTWFRIRQEIHYRMAMRRKHGIPDDDRRPFNVAYAAVVRERQRPEWLKLVGETLSRLPGTGTIFTGHVASDQLGMRHPSLQPSHV
jgi:hypothetical protein